LIAANWSLGLLIPNNLSRSLLSRYSLVVIVVVVAVTGVSTLVAGNTVSTIGSNLTSTGGSSLTVGTIGTDTLFVLLSTAILVTFFPGDALLGGFFSGNFHIIDFFVYFSRGKTEKN
jgi:hypothetical protein